MVEGTSSMSFGAVSKQKALGPSCFAECTVTDVVYPDTSEEFLLPILIEEGPAGLRLQQLGALPNFHTALGRTFPRKRAFRGCPVSWPPVSADSFL